MSLGHINGCKRARVTEHLLQQCRPTDAVVVENILTVVQDTVPCVNITQAVLRAHSNLYEITLSCSRGSPPSRSC